MFDVNGALGFDPTGYNASFDAQLLQSGMITQTGGNGESWLRFTIDDTVPELTRVEAHAGSRPITLEIFNDNDSVRFTFTLPAGQDIDHTLTNPQKRRCTLYESRAGTWTFSFPHRIQW